MKCKMSSSSGQAGEILPSDSFCSRTGAGLVGPTLWGQVPGARNWGRERRRLLHGLRAYLELGVRRVLDLWKEA